ncbi:MAG: family N-acetyltransferase [Novosphingobium sp.]|nr:family N-acetyltransferase [Novosphingobium sp.]
MSDTVLRAMLAADIPALARLGRDSFVAKFGTLYRPEDLSAFLEGTHSDAAVAAEFADPDKRYCLAERGGALVGYCKISLVCGWPEYARGARAIELKQLYTAPELSGQGLGAALMEWVLAQAGERQADEIQLSVWSGNDGAQRFYARYGFAKVADISFRVGEQLDEEFLFSLPL